MEASDIELSSSSAIVHGVVGASVMKVGVTYVTLIIMFQKQPTKCQINLVSSQSANNTFSLKNSLWYTPSQQKIMLC